MSYLVESCPWTAEMSLGSNRMWQDLHNFLSLSLPLFVPLSSLSIPLSIAKYNTLLLIIVIMHSKLPITVLDSWNLLTSEMFGLNYQKSMNFDLYWDLTVLFKPSTILKTFMNKHVFFKNFSFYRIIYTFRV